MGWWRRRRRVAHVVSPLFPRRFLAKQRARWARRALLVISGLGASTALEFYSRKTKVVLPVYDDSYFPAVFHSGGWWTTLTTHRKKYGARVDSYARPVLAVCADSYFPIVFHSGRAATTLKIVKRNGQGVPHHVSQFSSGVPRLLFCGRFLFGWMADDS